MPLKTLTPGEIAAQGLQKLKAKADPERARQVQRYFKESVRSFGIQAADCRQIAKELFESIRKEWTVQQAIELCEILLPRPELEAKGIASLILARYKKNLPRALFNRVKTWLTKNYLDNWASVDGLCPEVLGALLSRYPEFIEKIRGWVGHPNRWVKRASIVSFLKLTKREELLATIYEISTSLFGVDDDLIQKANGWVLREAGKRDMARLERFLLAHGPSIPRTTLRYASERFAEKQRQELLIKTKIERR